MKNLKLFLLTLLALCLVCSAAGAEQASPWAYDAGNLCLKRVGEVSGDVVIPAEVDGYPVNAIQYNSFNSNNAVTSLTMPDSLRAIQNGAIAWMDGLTSVTLNDGLEYIGSNFHNCNALTSLTVPASVRIVEAGLSFVEVEGFVMERPTPPKLPWVVSEMLRHSLLSIYTE